MKGLEGGHEERALASSSFLPINFTPASSERFPPTPPSPTFYRQPTAAPERWFLGHPAVARPKHDSFLTVSFFPFSPRPYHMLEHPYGLA